MTQPVPDDRLDRTIRTFLDRQGDAIEASALSPTRAAARVRTSPTGMDARALVRVALAALLAATLLLVTLAVVGQQPSPMSAFAPGSIAYVSHGVLYVADPDGQRPGPLASGDPSRGETLDHPAFSPDRRALAYLRKGATSSELVILSPSGATVGSLRAPGPSEMVGGEDIAIAYAWAPDGSRLAVVTSDDTTSIRFIGLDGRSIGSLPLPSDYRASLRSWLAPAPWSPDGRWIAVAACPTSGGCKPETEHYLLVATDGSDARSLKEVLPPKDGGSWLSWSPDSRLAVEGWSPGEVRMLSPDGSAEVVVPIPQGMNPPDGYGLAWSPDGVHLLLVAGDAWLQRLVRVGSDGSAAIIPTDAISPLVTPGPSAGGVVAISPDAQQLAAPSWSGDGRRILVLSRMPAAPDWTLWSIDGDGTHPRRIADGVGPYRSVGQVVPYDVAPGT